MSRDDLISINAGIVASVTENVIEYSPNSILIVVSNPLDVMTYVAHLKSKKSRNQVMGMAGILDTARYRAFFGGGFERLTERYSSPFDGRAWRYDGASAALYDCSRDSGYTVDRCGQFD